MTITLTDSAVSHLRNLLAEQQAPEGTGLRLSVGRGGCAGWQYEMEIGAVQTGDEVVEKEGVMVIVDGASLEKLRGVELDYCDDLTGTGFRIKNPNAARSCGCGTSFDTGESVDSH